MVAHRSGALAPNLSPAAAEELGRRLHADEAAQRAGIPPTKEHPEMTLADAYAAQREYAALRQRAGATLVGFKIGATNRVIQEQLGVDQPDYGHLFEDMVLDDGAVISLSRLIQPRVEVELAFVLQRRLAGPHVNAAQVLLATEAVIPCFEIIDSRVKAWRISFLDTVADNGSSALVVLGASLVDHRRVDLRTLGVILEQNGAVVDTGAGAAALGHPAASVAWLARSLSQFDRTLDPGQIVLSGSLTGSWPAEAGDWYRGTFGNGVGSVHCGFAP